jgi:formylmethanofuran dehydrogenase subunit E
MKHPESLFTCGTTHGTIVLSERERGKNMWTVFNKNTGKVVADGFETEVDAMMWIDAQENKNELAYAPF